MPIRLLGLCCLLLVLTGKVFGQDCTPPKIKLYQGTEKLSPCSPSDVVRLKVYGTTASYSVLSITFTKQNGDIKVTPYDPNSTEKPTEADVILDPLDAESGSATVKVTFTYKLTNPSCAGYDQPQSLTDTVTYTIKSAEEGGCSGACSSNQGETRSPKTPACM